MCKTRPEFWDNSRDLDMKLIRRALVSGAADIRIMSVRATTHFVASG